jgi:hypothetical protein
MPRASATKVHARILSCVATTSLDQVETTVAVDILDKMGLLDTRIKTKVGLHPQWVIDHTKGPIANAIFAVNNCTEAAALAEVARRDRRVTLAEALLQNDHLPDAAYQELEDEYPHLWRYFRRDDDNQVEEAVELEDEAPEADEAPPEHLRVPEKFAADGFRIFKVDDPFFYLPRRVPAGVGPADVDDLIAKAMEVNTVATLKTIIHDYYGPAGITLANGVRSTDEYPLWDLMSTHPTQLLAALEPHERAQVLSGMIEGLRQARRVQRAPSHIWDRRFVQTLIDADIDPDDRAEVGSRYPAPCNLLSPQALRLVLANPAWHVLAQMHKPNSHDMKLILKNLDRDHLGVYETLDNCSREMIATILAYKGPGAIENAFEDYSLDSLSRIFVGPVDPLFQRALDIADDSELIQYAFFGIRFQASFAQHPPTNQIPWFAERINAEVDNVEEVRDLDVEMAAEDEESYAGAATLEFAKALADQVLGAWEVLLESYGIGDVLVAEIKNTGVPLHAVMARLSPGEELPAMTFPQVIETLTQAPRG